MKYSFWIFLLFFNLAVQTGFSQEKLSKEEKKEVKNKKKAKRAAKKAKKIRDGDFMFTPLLAPGYTPELGFLFAVGGLASFKTNKKDSLIQRSSLPATLSYSTTGAIVFNAFLTSYWLKDKLRINGDFWFKNMPDHYWGIGYENGFNNKKSDSTTAYNRKWWWINPRFLYQVKKNYFVGLNVDYNYTKGSDAADQVASDPVYAEYNEKPFNSGFGAIFRFDSRDIPVDAWKGMLIDVRATFYADIFGGDNNFQVYQLDYRQYKMIVRKGSTLAWQVKLRISNGQVPYAEMSQLGSPVDLRGYTWGRYRDKNLFFILPEYRYMFKKKNDELSRHGMVAWVGVGNVFNFNENDNGENRWLPNVGLGYRFQIQPRMYIRLDYGIGRESSGFYFNFNQAF